MAVKRWIPLLLVAGFALVGCGQNLAGSAAVVGEQRLTDSQLADAATTLTQRLGIPESPQVSQALISRWVVAELVDELAARRGVDVTKGEVDAAIADEEERAGGREALEQGALQSGVLPDQIPDVVRTSLLVEAISKTTITGEDPTGQSGSAGPGAATQRRGAARGESRGSAPGTPSSCPSDRYPMTCRRRSPAAARL